jgi:hypothetical protein
LQQRHNIFIISILKFIKILFEISVLIVPHRKSQHVSVAKSNPLMLFTELIAVCSVKQKESEDTFIIGRGGP